MQCKEARSAVKIKVDPKQATSDFSLLPDNHFELASETRMTRLPHPQLVRRREVIWLHKRQSGGTCAAHSAV